ncbi:MAG TPA: hypothetical protein VNA20_07810 [Frankiaceae bacterium]|nr:hypothetical protein [Frankiaceae bacterium]
MSGLRPRALGGAAVTLALIGGYFAQGTYAAGIPANKVAASGSGTEVVHAATDTLLLSETVKINNPTDLVIGVSAECAILTQVTNSANGQTERAFGEVKIYVTINGKRVPVADDDSDQGRVVFCNRAQEQQWTDTATGPNAGDDADDQLRQFIDTRTANAFTWLAMNIGTEYGGTQNNVHKIEVWADWDVAESANAVAKAAVGNRTLILEPVKAANDERVTELG